MFPTIKAVLFDLDGTLAPIANQHFFALNNALEEFGYDPISRQDHLKTFDGLPTRTKLKLLNIDPLMYKDIEESKQQHTINFIETSCGPIPGQLVLLSGLSRSRYHLACCSNAKKETVTTALTKMKTINWFDLILSNESVKSTKPSPEIYLKASSYFGLKPSECLVLEDNHNGITAAQQAGCHLMVVDSPYTISYTAIKKKIYESNLENFSNLVKGVLK